MVESLNQLLAVSCELKRYPFLNSALLEEKAESSKACPKLCGICLYYPARRGEWGSTLEGGKSLKLNKNEIQINHKNYYAKKPAGRSQQAQT